MLSYLDVLDIYNRNHGTTQYFKRPYNGNLLYTDGIMDFQKSLEAFWIVDNVISYMPKILERFRKYESTYYTMVIWKSMQKITMITAILMSISP